jgi:stress protein
MIFSRGMRDKIAKYLNPTSDIEVRMRIDGNSVYDYCCFGVDKDGKLSDDRYMVFYNQTVSPRGEIRYQVTGKEVRFQLNLSQLPQTIDKLVFTASIDGNGTMKDIKECSFQMRQSGHEGIDLQMSGNDFQSEKAIIVVEVYRKGEWRISAVASGFNGGISALLAFYGGTEMTSEQSQQSQPVNQQVSQQAIQPISQQSQQAVEEKSKPQKISLKKGEKVSLEKNAGVPIIIKNGWKAKGKDYDLKALVRYRNGKLIYIGAANADESLQTPDGAVRHGGDVTCPGKLEHIDITWHPDIASVAVSSYSALENGTGSFHRYGVYVRIKNGNQVIEIPAEDTSANDRSYTLCFGEIVYGEMRNTFEVSALEMYSAPNSENRIGYRGNKVVMDIGPRGQTK